MNKLKNLPQKKYEPSFPMEILLAFKLNDPQTHTRSDFINQVLTAMCLVKPVTTKNIAYYLGLDPVKFAHAMEILTGHPFREIHRQWNLKEIARLEKEFPEWNDDDIAYEMGLADRSVIWNMKHPEVQLKRMRKRREHNIRYRQLWGKHPQ